MLPGAGGGLGVCVCVCEYVCVFKIQKKKERGYTQLQEAGRAPSVPVPSELAPWGQEEGEVRSCCKGKMDACHGRAAGWAPPGCPRARGAKTHKQKPQQIAGSPFGGGGRRLAEEPQKTWLGAGGRWRPARHR